MNKGVSTYNLVSQNGSWFGQYRAIAIKESNITRIWVLELFDGINPLNSDGTINNEIYDKYKDSFPQGIFASKGLEELCDTNKPTPVWVCFEDGDVSRPIVVGYFGSGLKNMGITYGSGVSTYGATAGFGEFTVDKKYNIDDDTIKWVATMVTGEGGGSDLTACRQYASHVPNLMEHQGNNGTDSNAVRKTVKKSSQGGWYNDDSWGRGCSDEAIQAVKEVLLEGKRYLPRYVCNFDTFPMDVVTVKEKDQYTKGEPIDTRFASNEFFFYAFFVSGDMATYCKKCYDKYSGDDKLMQGSNNSNTTGRVGKGGATQARKAVEAALSKQGTPYVWGGTGPDGFDCSGLCQWAYKQAGVDIGRTTNDQLSSGVIVNGNLDKCLPGDLWFPSNHHVMMIVDPKTRQLIHAPQTGDVIKIVTIGEKNSGSYYSDGKALAIRRICP